MPTVYAEPTIQELLDAFEDGVRATRDKHVDAREGAILQHWSGVGAVLWSRCGRRTTDLWRAVYLESAEANELTTLLQGRYAFTRIPDAYGTGTTSLTRPTAAAGAGTIWKGTRIAVTSSAATPTEAKYYVVTANTPVGGAATFVSGVPVRADLPGAGTAINISSGARVDDPLWDATWTVSSLVCDDGTSFEAAADARARWRDVRRASRPGYEEAIIAACNTAGADVAYLFSSDYPGDDSDAGLNMAYVGDETFASPAALRRSVIVTLEGYRVLGDNLQVRPLQRTAVTIDANVYLWEGPLRTNHADTTKRLKGALEGYFDRVDKFGYQRDAMAGAMLKAAPEVQFVTFNAPSADADIVSIVDGALNFPSILDLFSLDPDDIDLTFLPPL